MRWGVPMEGFYLNVAVTFEMGMIAGSPFYWVLGFIPHLIMRYYANKDPNFFREWRMWAQTKGAHISSTFLALPVSRDRDGSEMPTSV